MRRNRNQVAAPLAFLALTLRSSRAIAAPHCRHPTPPPDRQRGRRVRPRRDSRDRRRRRDALDRQRGEYDVIVATHGAGRARSALLTARLRGTRVEVEASRTASTTTYANPDGTFTTDTLPLVLPLPFLVRTTPSCAARTMDRMNRGDELDACRGE